MSESIYEEKKKPFDSKAHNKAYYEANKEKIKERSKAWRQDNKEKIKAQTKAHYNANKEKIIAYSKTWREANQELCQASAHAYNESNKEKIKAQTKSRYAADPEKHKARGKAWRKANLDRAAFIGNRRRAKKLQATPSWANQHTIQLIYTQCKNLNQLWNTDFAVDHIIPLQNPLVCGLHCEANLQLLVTSLNSSKGNSFQADW